MKGFRTGVDPVEIAAQFPDILPQVVKRSVPWALSPSSGAHKVVGLDPVFAQLHLIATHHTLFKLL